MTPNLSQVYTLRTNVRTGEFSRIREWAALGDFRRRRHPGDDVHPDGEPRVLSAAAGNAEGSGGVLFADGPVYRYVRAHCIGDESARRNYCGANRREARAPDRTRRHRRWIGEPW